MVNYNSKNIDVVFSALADPTRRAIMARLALGESRVTELAAPFDMSLPAVSKHLRVLERAGLLHKKRDGKSIRCRLNPETLRGVTDWVDRYRHFWDGQFDQLTQYLEGAEPRQEKPLE